MISSILAAIVTYFLFKGFIKYYHKKHYNEE